MVRSARLEAGRHPHGHEVFLVGIGRDGADARRHGEGSGLRHQRRRGDLHHHVAGAKPRIAGQERRQALRKVGIHQPLHPPLGDGLQGRQRHGQDVERLRHRLAMEVAARDDVAVLEDQRIVGRSVELHLHRLLGEADRVGHGAEHLRRAAEAVGVLDPGIVLPVRLPDLAVLEQRPHERGGADLAGMGAGRVDSRVQRRRVPRKASRLIAAAPTAVRQSTSASCTISASRAVCAWVPLMNAIPSLGANR